MNRFVLPRAVPSRSGRLSRLAQDSGGAALVEFAFAIMPVLCLFFGMVQWCINAYVNLIVQHAAFVAARAEAVMRPGMPDNGSEDGSKSDIEAAIAPLFVHVPSVFSVEGFSNVSVSFSAQAGRCEQKMNTVKVSVEYPCKVPLGNAIACGGVGSGLPGLGFHQKLSASASFPNQGSFYQKVWHDDIGGSHSGCGGGE
jgi:hypothetical protein